MTSQRQIMLISFALATIFLIPAALWIPGLLAAAVAATLIIRDESSALRQRLGVLLSCVLILGFADINPSLSDENFLTLTPVFALVLIGPIVIFFLTGNRKLIRFRFWPRKWRKQDLIYTILSIPLAWVVLKSYEWGNREFFDNELFRQWHLPEQADESQIRRLFIGINLVGIWDELFFVNTSFAILRSLFRFPIANTLQAIIYTAVLYDMAFVGCGFFVVFLFAWTQGSMFEKSESLLWVLIVHLIVDYFLVAFIVQTHYPDYGLDFLWRKGF